MESWCTAFYRKKQNESNGVEFCGWHHVFRRIAARYRGRSSVVLLPEPNCPFHKEDCWPTVLANLTLLRVVNLAQPRATVATALNQAKAIKEPRSLVIVEIGGNDLLGETDASVFHSNLDTLVSSLRLSRTQTPRQLDKRSPFISAWSFPEAHQFVLPIRRQGRQSQQKQYFHQSALICVICGQPRIVRQDGIWCLVVCFHGSQPRSRIEDI